MSGDRKGAIENFRKVIETSPRNTDALNNLAYLLSEEDSRLDEALKHAQKAVELAPQQLDYCDTLGWILYRKGIYGSAVKYLEMANTSNPNPVVMYHLAMAYTKSGDRNRGKSLLQAALKVNANLPEAKIAQELLSR
jgi:tetratricopeptide (TPR) repeat protein